jgi:tetratricopeptide (TPR) repeat protein
MLKRMADGHLQNYHTSHSVAALEKAISMYEEALRQRPFGDERRTEALNDLGDALYHSCCCRTVDDSRMDLCIEVLREALLSRPPGHPLRDQSLHNLARSLRVIRYEEELGSLDVIMECASLDQEALDLRPSGHPERAKSLNNLANNLEYIAKQTGDRHLLVKVVSIRREVVSAFPFGHPMHQDSLYNLGTALCANFEHLGGFGIIAEAISVAREALQHHPVGHPDRYMALDLLAHALSLRSTHDGNRDSILMSVEFRRGALQLLAGDHPERAKIMSNLACSLLDLCRTGDDRSSLDEAIRLLREAVTLQRPGRRSYDGALQLLAEALEAKFDNDSYNGGLEEAVKLHRMTLNLRPIGHTRRFWSLEGLGRVLCKLGSGLWPEALSCYEEAVQLCPVGCPARARLLSGMGKCFLYPGSPSFSFSEGISCLSKAYGDTFSHVNGRLKLAVADFQQLEAAYRASKKGTHERLHTPGDERVFNLYIQVIGLLPLAANFGLDHSMRLQAVSGCDEIVRNAAARAVLYGCLPQAITMLEQGRGVFWTQTLHLRTAAFDDVPEDDHQELKRMLQLLEHGARQEESFEDSIDERERDLEKRRQLNEDVQVLISKIRGYPGLDRFLLPPIFGALLGSLPDGFVVIVNASKLGYHAMLLHRATGLATSLALKPFRTGFDFATLRAQLPRDMVSLPERDANDGTRAMRLNGGKAVKLEDMLSALWSSVVNPIIEALGLHVSNLLATIQTLSDFVV